MSVYAGVMSGQEVDFVRPFQEMGFSWAQSSEALKTHATLEEAVEALFGDESNPGPGGKRHSVFLRV